MSSYEMMGATLTNPSLKFLDDYRASLAAPAAPPAPSANPPTDFTIKAAALPMRRFKRIDAMYIGYLAGYFNSSTFSKDKYTWAMACAARLEKSKMIPTNTLEFSRSFRESGKDGWNNVAWYYNEASKVQYIPYDEYFATIQRSGTYGSEANLIDYMNLLCMWELTGVSFIEKYNDNELIKNSGIPAAQLPVYKYIGYDAALFEKFMRDYYDAVLSFASKITEQVMMTSTTANLVSQQFDLKTVTQYTAALMNGICNPGYFDTISGQIFETEFYYVEENINSRHYDGFVAPPVGTNFVNARNHSGTQLTEYKYDKRYYNVSGIPFVFDKKPVIKILKDIFTVSIAPIQTQLQKLMVQWDFLQSDPSKLSAQDIEDLQNPKINLFLRYNVGKTTELKQVVMDQLAKSNVIRNADKSIVPPNLQNRTQSVINLPKTYAKFTPKYTYIPEGKVPSHYDDPKKKFPFGLLIAGVAVAAGAYYSTK